jgi:hypothetical protein
VLDCVIYKRQWCREAGAPALFIPDELQVEVMARRQSARGVARCEKAGLLGTPVDVTPGAVIPGYDPIGVADNASRHDAPNDALI